MAKPPAQVRVNVRLLLIVCGIAIALVAVVLVGHQMRKTVIARNALAEGNRKLAAKEWQAAAAQFKIYLSKFPDDKKVLSDFATAHMEVRPLRSENIAAAIAAHRRLIRLDPRAEHSYSELAMLYNTIGNFDELSYVARRKQEFFPGDSAATLWQANAYLGQGRRDESRTLLAKFVDDKGHDAKPPAELISACIQLSRIELDSGTESSLQQARTWLDRALQFDPNSGEALVRRAQVLRINAERAIDGGAELRQAAIKDLDRAATLAADDPRLHLLLSQERLEHNEFERAWAELHATDSIPEQRLRDFFVRIEDWRMLYFSHAANISLSDGSAKKNTHYADDVLSTLKEPTQRAVVLPAAIELYAAGGRVDRAEACLKEYHEATALLQPTPAVEEAQALLDSIVLWEQGFALRVIEQLRSYEERDVTRPRILKLLGQAYAKTNQPRRAIKALRAYLRVVGDDPSATLLLSRQYVLTQDWAAAIETARRAELRWSGELDAKLMRLEAALRSADVANSAATRTRLEEFAKELDTLREASPNRSELHVMRAVVAEELGDAALAEKILTDTIPQCDDPRLAEAALVRLMLRGDKSDAALELCRSATQKSPTDVRSWLLLGEALESLDRSSEAIDALNQGLSAISDNTDRARLSTRVAILELEHDRRQAGIERLKKICAAEPANLDARSMLLDAPEILRDAAESARLIAEIREAEGESGLRWRAHQAAFWLASGEEWRSRQKEITELLSYCQDVDPGWAIPALLLGGMHERLAAYTAAEGVYRRALAANPAAREVAERLLNLLESQRRYTEATQLLEQMEKASPLGAERRAALLIGVGEWQQAMDFLRLRVANDESDDDARALLARLVYRQSGDVERALQVLDAVGGEKNNEKLAFARIAIYRAAGQNDKAESTLDHLIEAKPTFRNLATRAALFDATDQPEQAERDYRKLTEIANDESGYVLLGSFLSRHERLDDVVNTYRAALEKFPDSTVISARLVAVLITRQHPGDAEAAQSLLRKIAASNSDQPQVLWLRALLKKSERSNNNGQETEQLLERVVELEPTHVEAHLGLIDAAMRRGDYATARERCIRALGAEPNDPRLMATRAQAEYVLGNTELAKELVRLAIRGQVPDPDVLNTWVDLARGASDKEMLTEGKPLLEAAIQRHPNDDRLRRALARCVDALGDTQEALIALDQYVSTRPPPPSSDLLLLLSELANKAGDSERTVGYLDAAAKAEPNSPKVLRARVMWHALRNEPDAVMRLTAELKPTSPEFVNIALLSATMLGDSPSPEAKARGRKLLEDVLAAQPTFADARLALARMAFKNGDEKFAEQQYKQVLANDPNHVRALNDYAWILATGLKRPDEALKLVDQALSIAPDQANLRDTRGETLLALGGRESEARSEFERCAALAPRGGAQCAKALLKLARLCAAPLPAEAARHASDALTIDAKQHVFSDTERQELETIQKQAGRSPASTTP